jgi:nucleotide-binding universal stress UspA family protein
MRILLALDGSAASEVARDLVGGLPWPAGTAIATVTVLEPVSHLGATLTNGNAESVLTGELLADLRSRTATLDDPDRLVECRVVRGRPASTIVDEAAMAGSDLVILGSRGHGPLRTMLLGSVSAEVADLAPCPVLIARDRRVSRLLVATDGGPQAALAVSTIARWGVFAALPTLVVGVIPSATVSAAGFAPLVSPRLIELHRKTSAALRTARSEAARTAARQLAEAGLRADWELREGDPTAEILTAAERFGADLVVTGTRALPTAEREVMGSVARNVVQHAAVSVLIVRPMRARRGTSAEEARAPVSASR